MHKYISKDDCYYTDTDLAVLGSMLPEDDVSPTELGKLKLEHKLKEGIFLAPKSYCLIDHEGNVITKHKGDGKAHVNKKDKWFRAQLAEPSRRKQIYVERSFQKELKTLRILRKVNKYSLGVRIDNERKPLYNPNNQWVNTEPYHVIDNDDEEVLIYKIQINGT